MSLEAQSILIACLVVTFKWAPYTWLLWRVAALEHRRWWKLLLLSAARTLVGMGVALLGALLLLGPITPHGSSGSASSLGALLLVLILIPVRAVEWRLTLRFVPGWWALFDARRNRLVRNAVLLSYAMDALLISTLLGVEVWVGAR